MNDMTQALLDAHVQYELSRLQGDSLRRLIDEHIAACFEWFGDVKFNDAVTREQIGGVIQRYVIDLQVSGGITELAGEMATAIFSSEWSASARVKDICDEQAYEEFSEKVLTLESARRSLIRSVISTPAAGVLTARVLSRLAIDLLFRRGRSLKTPMPGALADFSEKVIPDLEERLSAFLSGYMERHSKQVLEQVQEHVLVALDPVTLRELLDEIWDGLANRRIAEAARSFNAQDLEDFIVLGYEFWLRFRKTKYFHAMATEVVDGLFAKYGDESVSVIIEDMGISEEMVRSELKTFFVPLFEQARGTGFLEQRVRAVLEPFYRSPEVRAILTQ